MPEVTANRIEHKSQGRWEAATLPEYDTETLFLGSREIVIHHGDASYRMKITKQGKLILNK